jgi:FkbM family methyltransferase
MLTQDLMNTLFEKIKRSFRYYYYGRKNGWAFSPNIAHLSGGKMAKENYEPNVSQKLAQILKPGATFIDVGANIGYFTKLAAEAVGKRGNVYAFEIELDNYYALHQNVNNYSNTHVLHLGISNNNSFATVNHSSHSANHSMVHTKNHLDGKKFSVATITLDHFWKIYLQKAPIQLIKIDVEGAELMVLNGMDDILSENMIAAMIIELYPDIIQNAGFETSDLFRILAKNFYISIIDEEYRSLVTNPAIASLDDFQAISNHLITQERYTDHINLLCQQK